MAQGVGRPPSVSSSSPFAAIEEMMRARLGRDCLYVPSCRLGMYLALRHWVKPGGRVLMAPVNDDVIFFVVLAAGLKPVMAPVHHQDGSIDVAAIPDATWEGLSAVLTVNIYGNPDPMEALRSRCHLMGIPLIEDCAHAIGTTVGGKLVGTFGEASTFSLGKHLGARTGGILAVADPRTRRTLEAARDELLAPSSTVSELAYGIRPYLESAVRGLRLTSLAWAVVRMLGMEERGPEIRMPLRAAQLVEALNHAPALLPFNDWVKVDMHDYRMRPGPLRLRRTERMLAGLDPLLEEYRSGTAKLLASRWAIRRPGPVQPLFQVPLLVEDREGTRNLLHRNRIHTGYLYDPPLDVYAAAFTEHSRTPEAAEWFGKHAMPADPLKADKILKVLDRAGVAPAPPFTPRQRGGHPLSTGRKVRRPSSRTLTTEAFSPYPEAQDAAGPVPAQTPISGSPVQSGIPGSPGSSGFDEQSTMQLRAADLVLEDHTVQIRTPASPGPFPGEPRV
ncbi:DegT/DnrJ/EryC1/StrS family aminotransferase [Streptomyces sp. NPDC020875]|uniref:DegT/DnrJ/EryC1/StrS family aminotransferase n=1 Tax=Streptomyces sp. NPDC020875 TaxID=3154898 RepID=UPI0033EFFD0C